MGFQAPFILTTMYSVNDLNNFQSSPAIKIRFPNPKTQGYWAVEELTQKTTYAVPVAAILMIIGCARPIAKVDLYSFVTSKLRINSEIFENKLKSLIEKKIILFADQIKQDRTLKNLLKWKMSGWDAAADYHFYTWDAPFLDYSKEGGGHAIDRTKMVRYQSLSPDVCRYKKYTYTKSTLSLPNPGSIEENKIPYLSTEDRIKYLLACIFGKTSEKFCHWTEVPLIRRTSPSGGCRHPTEGYFIPSDTIGIERGFYHIQTEPIALCLIPTTLEALGPLDNTVLGTIIITSVFERNMYRYREPRTFRTVHMDVGHILASTEILSHEMEFQVTIHLQFDEKKILKMIGSSSLEEGVMALVTLRKRE